MERRDRLTAAVSVIIILNVFCVFRNLILDNTHTHTQFNGGQEDGERKTVIHFLITSIIHGYHGNSFSTVTEKSSDTKIIELFSSPEL